MLWDLRKTDCGPAINRVQRALDVTFDHSTRVTKRRSIGFRTDRDTWVRIEARAVERIDGQGWNGVEAASVVDGVAKPRWYQAASWHDADLGMMWRADETELVSYPPVIRGGDLTAQPDLPDSWWVTLTSSLSVLSRYTTSRVATPTMRPMTQDRLSSAIRQVFPDVDTTVDEWTTAHGDFYWTNLTAPECYLLDWEDWGTAPRGFDASCLWIDSLTIPSLADTMYQHLRGELDTRTGLLCQLMACAETMSAPAGYADHLVEPAKYHAHRIVAQLAKLE